MSTFYLESKLLRRVCRRREESRYESDKHIWKTVLVLEGVASTCYAISF